MCSECGEQNDLRIHREGVDLGGGDWEWAIADCYCLNCDKYVDFITTEGGDQK